MRNALLIASNTFSEVLRQKLVLLVGLIAVALVMSSKYLLSLDLGHEQLRFVFDFGSGAIGFFGSIMAIVATCQIFHSEMDGKTVVTLFSKPVSSAQFAAGKFLGAAAALALFAAAAAIVTCAMLFLTRLGFGNAQERLSAGLSANYFGVAVFAVLQWVKLCSIAAITSFVCAASSSLLFSAVISFMIFAISMLGEATASLGGKGGFFQNLALWIFPDLHVFNASEVFAFAPVDWGSAGAAFVYGAIYIFAALIAASLMFSRREF